MSYLQELKESFDLEGYLDASRIDYCISRGWANLEGEECPNCYVEESTGISLDRKVFYCRNCRHSMDLISWIKGRERIKFQDAVELIKNYQCA
jgi:endogenous inhibitor of DNA gyrase (YacG/DUF329 family)